MKRYYKICLHNICIEAPFFPDDSSDWRLFEAEESVPDIEISCSLCKELPEHSGVFRGRAGDTAVYAQGNFICRASQMGRADGALTCYNQSDTSRSSTVFTEESYRVLMDSRYMWNSISLAQLVLPRKTVFIHASHIDYNGKSLLFSAPCGTGKSTQAALWKKHRNAETVNGDKAGISVENGVVYAHGVPFCGTSGICLNRSNPLGAVVLLRKAPQNSVKRLRGIEALQGLMQNIYLDLLAPEEQRICIDLLIEILSEVPVYLLSCTADENAVAALEAELKNGGII